MTFSKELLFFFSALGVFNSILLSFYFLLFAKPRHPAHLFLGGLLLSLSLRIGKSVFFYFNSDLAKIYLQIGVSACFLIGPFLFFYLRAMHPSYSTSQHKQALVIVSSLILALIAFGILYPYEAFPELWGTYFLRIIYYQWLLFLMISGLQLKPLFRILYTSPKSISYNETWLLSVYIGTCLIWLAYFTASYTSYIVGALSLSFVLYLSILVIVRQRKVSQLPKANKYANQKISPQEVARLKQQLDTLMNDEALYKNPNISSPDIAKRLNISTHLFSQLINDNLGKNFSAFINEYRIEAAKEILKSQSHLKIEIIAENCGFNSTSTFYTAFKKFTGTTPSKFANN